MITIKQINKAVCDTYKTALAAAVPRARLLAEDVRTSAPPPCGKVELDDGADAHLMQSGRERSVTFRLYYFPTDCKRPKLENLAVREAIGEAFLYGMTVGDVTVCIDDGVSFSVTDGVLTTTLDLILYDAIDEPEAETMETLNYDTEVKT